MWLRHELERERRHERKAAGALAEEKENLPSPQLLTDIRNGNDDRPHLINEKMKVKAKEGVCVTVAVKCVLVCVSLSCEKQQSRHINENMRHTHTRRKLEEKAF